MFAAEPAPATTPEAVPARFLTTLPPLRTVPETVLVPYKNPVDNARYAYTAAKYNQPFDLDSIAEQIGFLSVVIALVPGDVICTGTCAGVGAAKNRFLAAGDVVVAEIEPIGRLENPVIQG